MNSLPPIKEILLIAFMVLITKSEQKNETLLKKTRNLNRQRFIPDSIARDNSLTVNSGRYQTLAFTK